MSVLIVSSVLFKFESRDSLMINRRNPKPIFIEPVVFFSDHKRSCYSTLDAELGPNRLQVCRWGILRHTFAVRYRPLRDGLGFSPWASLHWFNSFGCICRMSVLLPPKTERRELDCVNLWRDFVWDDAIWDFSSTQYQANRKKRHISVHSSSSWGFQPRSCKTREEVKQV